MLEFGAQINLDILNLMVFLTFSISDQEIKFLGKFDQKKLFKLKLGSETNSNMNSMVMLTFFLLKTRNNL